MKKLLLKQQKFLISVLLILVYIQIFADKQAYSLPEKEEKPLTASTPGRVTLNFDTNYWDIYPCKEAIYLRSLKHLSGGVGVELTLDSSMDGFSHFEYSTNDEPFQRNIDGKIFISFNEKHTPEASLSKTRIKSVTKTGKTSKIYTIDIDYYPREIYTASSNTSPGYVIVKNTDLLLSSSRVEDWVLYKPNEKEKAYAKEKWGSLVKKGNTDYENAMVITKAIIDDLETHRGTPSDEMIKKHPFTQYERALAGKDRVWCKNIAEIFVYACNSLGVPCRGILMAHQVIPQTSNKVDYMVLLAEGHGSTEIFSNNLNQWVWIDLTFYVLNAYLGEEGPINLAEFYRYLNDPARFENLRITVYDPKTGTQKVESVLESSKKASLFNYFKKDQRFYYTKIGENNP